MAKRKGHFHWMVGLDLGTRLIKVHMTSGRMKPSLRGNPELIFYYQKSENPCRRSNQAPLQIPRKRNHPHQLLSQDPQCHYVSREKQLQNLQYLIQQRTCSSRTSHPSLNKHIGIVYVRERSTFLRSLQEVDVMTSKGRHMVMEIIREQAPDVILMAPVCGPWSNMQNIQQDQQKVGEKRRRYLPMVEFVASISIARYQLKHRRYFIIENPQTSRIWYLKCMQQLFSDPSVTWGDFQFCAYGLKDPESGLRSLKPTSLSLMHCLPPEVMRPIFRRCKHFSSSVKHEHQPLEGNAGTFGSRTKLAQVYPYQFCQDLAHILLRHLQVKPLDNEVYLLEDLFEPFTITQVDILRKEMEAIDKEFNMTSSSLQPLLIQDPLVQKFQKTMNLGLKSISSSKILMTGDVRTCGMAVRS